MPVNATVTAKSGPNITNTAKVFNGLTGILFLPDRQVLQLLKGGDTNTPPEFEFDLTGVTTVTCVVSGTTYSFTISQDWIEYMAMGIVSNKDFDSELDKCGPKESKSVPISNDTVVKEAEVIDVNRGRGPNPEVPDSLRKLIGDEHITSGRAAALELASSFGISPSSVAAYANGATSTSTYHDTPNRTHLNKTRGIVSGKAFKTLKRAITHITDEKLLATNAKELAGVAKDMAAVIRTMEPEPSKSNDGGMTNNGPTFVFYSPQQRKEESFDVVHAKE